MSSNVGFYCSEVEFDSAKIEKINSENGCDDKIYTYEEALDLAGTGKYDKILLVITSVALLAMTIDLYGFAIIVTACSCDFQLDQDKKSVLLTVAFVGAMITAYPWGYLSDTRGRKKCLLVALAGSCLASVLTAFSVNWIMMGAFKFLGGSLCSCIQSVTYALIGECTPKRVRSTYMLLFTSIGTSYLIICYTPAYFILNLNFSYNLGLIHFTPWRFLTLVLALPLGVCAIAMGFLYESPKFILKTGKDEEALDILKRICEWNGRGNYPVKRITLSEEGNVESNGLPLLESFRVQTVPIFKPPYLWRTLQLFFLIAVVLGSTNSLFVWFPFVATAFYDGISSSETPVEGLCNVIGSSQNNTGGEKIICTSAIDVKMLWISIIQCIIFLIINLIIVKFSARKKAVLIIILVVAGVSAICTMLISDPYNISSFILFFGVLLTSPGVGIIYTYCVDIYPTSHRGMISSLILLTGRISGLVAIYLIGSNILTHCSAMFYTLAGIMFAATAIACFLPPDKPKKTS